MNENPYSASPYGGIAPATIGEVPAEAVSTLQRTRPWMMFLSILGYIGSAFALLGSIGVLVFAAVLSSGSIPGLGSSSPMGGAETGIFVVMAFIYLIFGAIYLYLSIRISKTCSAITRLQQSASAIDLVTVLEQQRKLWKTLGIMVIVTIALYIVMMIASFGWSMKSASSMSPRPVTVPAPTAP